MKRRNVVIAGVVVAITFFAGGYFLGVREGERVGSPAFAPLRGSLATRFLTELKEGNTRGASLTFEAEVNWGLVALNDLSESPIDRLTASLLNYGPGTYDIGYSAANLANYRKVNPSPFTGEFLTHDPEETAEQRILIDKAIEHKREADEIVNRMVKRYATK